MKHVCPHEMIMASAGSGKTYALVSRYLRLIALGVPANRIIALTFTRKAAGEFLREIFLRLMEAAKSEAEAKELSRAIHLPEKNSAFFRERLCSLTREMAQLDMGTIDSFFARIVGGFPYELGLAKAHRIMDPFEQAVAQEQALASLFSRGNKAEQNELLQFYKQYTWGNEDNNVYAAFEKIIQTCQSLYLENTDISRWGRTEAIFKRKPWWAEKTPALDKLIETAEKLLGQMDLKPKMASGFDTLFSRLRNSIPGIDPEVGVLWENLMARREDLAEGQAEIPYNRGTLEAEGELSQTFYRILQAYVQREVLHKCAVTQAIGEILKGYDTAYEGAVRESGALVFADLPALLVKAFYASEELLSPSELAYRLDGARDHWLLDEFQDTSRLQWKVLVALIDEVLQDSSGERSFFCVGDVKQSIYDWRGGDARLFGEIFEHYGDNGRHIRKATLSHSWRSAPPILECVNALFGKNLSQAFHRPEVVKRWEESWEDHKPSKKTAKLSGYAGWGLVQEEMGLEAACIELVREVDPLGKGLSCAVLVRKNPQVRAIAQALREAGIPTSMEALLHRTGDNIV